MKWIVVLILIHFSQGITVQLTSPQCFRVPGGMEYKVHYVISGVDEGNIVFKATRGNDILLRAFNKREFSDVISLPPGNISLCVQPTDSAYKTLVIDFYPLTNPLKNIVTRHDLGTVHQQLTKLYDQLQTNYRNQLFRAERDYAHRVVLDSTQWKIQWFGVIKVVLLFIAAIAQLWIIKGFFKNRNLPYEALDSVS